MGFFWPFTKQTFCKLSSCCTGFKNWERQKEEGLACVCMHRREIEQGGPVCRFLQEGQAIMYPAWISSSKAGLLGRNWLPSWILFHAKWSKLLSAGSHRAGTSQGCNRARHRNCHYCEWWLDLSRPQHLVCLRHKFHRNINICIFSLRQGSSQSLYLSFSI